MQDFGIAHYLSPAGECCNSMAYSYALAIELGVSEQDAASRGIKQTIALGDPTLPHLTEQGRSLAT
jgi:hypothetical protein